MVIRLPVILRYSDDFFIFSGINQILTYILAVRNDPEESAHAFPDRNDPEKSVCVCFRHEMNERLQLKGFFPEINPKKLLKYACALIWSLNNAGAYSAYRTFPL